MTNKPPKEKTPYKSSTLKVAKPLKIKEWTIKQLKAGSSPNKISQDIKKLFGVYVSMMNIYRWKKKYIEVTGEDIPSWCELNKTIAEKNKNKCANRIYRNTEIKDQTKGRK
jgi:hypothetical protein